MLSVSESAKQLNISTARVRALIKSGQLPAVKNGREWVLREEDVLQRLADRPGPGRPKTKNEGSWSNEMALEKPGALHELYEQCRVCFQHIPTEVAMAQAKSDEEAAFYMAVSDFFLQRKQAQIIKAGVF